MEFTDQINRKIILSETPKRIISLVPSQTELLVDLGLADKICGLTKFCVHPPGFKETKTIVGGTKAVHYEVIKSLNPDIILCNKEENTKEIVEMLAKDFTVHVSDVETIEDNFEMIEQYGKILNAEEKADEIIQKTKDQLKKFESYISTKKKLKVAYFIWRKPWMLAGGDTFINYLLELNKFENVYSNSPRYPEVQLEELKAVDYYFLSSEPFPFEEKHKNEIEAVVNKGDFRFVDGEFFSWYGSRLAKAFGYFRELREGMEN